MGLQKIGKKIKKQTAQAVQKAQSAAKTNQTPKRTGATAAAKKTGQAAGQKVQYYSNKNNGGARRTGTAVKNKVGAKVKANKNTPTPYQRQKTAQANVKMRQLNIPTMTKDYFKNPQKNPLDRRDLLSQIGGALQAAQNPADRFHGLKERSVTRSPMEQLRADAMAGRGAWASDLRVETKKSDKEKAKEIVENSKRYFRNKKIARQDLSEWDRRNMNAAQQRQVQEAKLRYKEAQKAGKKEDAARAHREAENLRGLHGYSGGAAGDQFIRPELSQGEYNALNSQGELAMRQARMARQRAVTEDEIARADQRIEAILRAPGYREGPVTDADTSRGWSFGPEGRRMWAGTREQNAEDARQSRAALQATGEGIVGGLAYAGQIANRANRDRYEAANMDQWIADADDYISAQSDLEYYDNFVRQFGRAPDDMPNRNVLVMRLNRAIQARAQLERVQGDVDSLYFDPTMAEVLGLPTTRDETFGERMLRQAAEHQAEATEGMTGAERFLTDAMISTGQSLPGMALGTIPGIGPALGLGVLGAQAAGSRAYELTQQGLTAGEALRGGLISGGIEILTEKLPLEHFAKIVSGKSGRAAIKNILRQAGLEGTEEAVSYVGNYVADVAQNNPDAQFSWAELLENAGMGAVSGGIFGVGGSLVGEGRGRAAMPQIGDIQARTQEQAEAITQVQDLVSDERTQEAKSLLEDTKAYNEMKQTGLYSQDELGMMRDALNERYARLAGVEEVPQTVTEPAPRTLEEAAQQRTMDVQPELPPVQWERSKFPPSSLVGSLIDAARENNARNKAAEQLRADQAAFRAQQAQREAQAAQTQAQPVQTQTAKRQAQPVGQARSMTQQSPQVQRDILARNVSAFGENGRKAIMEAYQGGDAGSYRQAFAQVYDQAVSGKTQEQIARPSALTEPQFYAAVQSGMNDRAAARPAGRVAGRNKNAGVDWRDQYVRQMDRKTAKMVDGVARALGVRVIFADEGSILTGTGAQANAEIVGNVVRIEKNNPNPVRKLIGHELTHRMQDLSPETYQTFRDYVMSIPGAQNALEQTLALYESGTGGFTREAAMDELAADFAGELWDSSEKLQDFIRKNYTNRTLLERVRDAFRALAAKLTGREKVQADEAVRLLEDALGAASEAVEMMELGTSRTEKGGKRFSLKAPVEETDRFIASHNLNAEKMRGALELGGLAMPSVAMTPANIAHTWYGDITVVFGKDSVDPKDKRNQIFSDDAYTPTVPEAGYKISSDVTKRLRERIDALLDGLPSDLRSKVALDTENIRDNIQRWGEDFGKVYGDNIALKTAYLIDQGETIKVPMLYAETSSGMDKATLRKAIRMFGDMDKLNSADKLDAFIEPARELERQYYREKFPKKPELADTLVKDFGWSDVDKLRNDAQYLKRHGDLRKITDLDALEKTVSRKLGTKKKQASFEDWLRRESEGIIEKKGIRNDKDIFTRTGNWRSFEQLYDDYNLANIVKAMQQDVKQGKVGFLTGSGNIRGAAAKTYGSIEDARKEIGRIRETGEDEDFTAQYKTFDQRCRDLCAEMTEGTRLAAWDAAEALTETLAKHKTEPAIYRYLMKEWGSDGYLNITPEIAQEAAELIKEAQKLPIHYMEAKLYRAVDLTEPLAYVVPSDLDKDLKQQMKDAGLPMKTYKAGDREDRLNKVNAVKGARFSISARTDADYMAAVETGDMETAQRMVDEAAKSAMPDTKILDENGNLLKVYHGSDQEFTVFDRGKTRSKMDIQGSFFSPWEEDAGGYGTNVRAFYLNIKNPADERTAYQALNKFKGEDKAGVKARILLGARGYDGVNNSGEEYIAFKSEQIKSADPVTYDDNGNVIPLSERFQDDNLDIRFSLKGTGGMDNARLLRENEKLRDRVEYWKGQTKKSDRAKVEPKEVKKLARRLATDFSSAMDRTEIAGELQAIYDGLGKDWTYDQAYEAAHALAMNMVEQASESDGFLYNEYEPMRVFFRETPLVISPEIKRGITDYNDWRKAQMGRLRLQSGEQSNIDQVYQEVSQLWPEWFDEEREATSLDQLERIVEVMDGIYTQEENNPFQDDLEGPAGYLAAEIMENFWDLPNVKKTWADRAEARLGREVTRRLDMQEKYQEKLQQVREDRDRKLKEQSAAYLGRTKARSQRQKERERRAQIVRHCGRLSAKLKSGTDKQHVPEVMQRIVATALDSINLGSGFTLVYDENGKAKRVKDGSGETTKRTEAFEDLRKFYQQIITADPDEDLAGEMPEIISKIVVSDELPKMIDGIIGLRDTPIANLGKEDLDKIWETVKAIETTISTYDKALGQARFETISEPAFAIQDYAAPKKDRRNYAGAMKHVDRLLNVGMLKPIYFLYRLGDGGKMIWKMIEDAQGTNIRYLDEIRAYQEEHFKPGIAKRLEKEKHTFNFDGQKIELTTAQLINLYNLRKREQAEGHILEGGFRPDQIVKGIRDVTPAAPWHFTAEQIGEMLNVVARDAELVRIADAMMDGIKPQAVHGNAASMEVYGIKKYRERNYWPIESDENQTQTDIKNEAVSKTVAGSGFAKATQKGANNAIILRSAFDVYDDHVVGMAKYAAWLGPLENLRRILNFRYKDEIGHFGGGVKEMLTKIIGKDGPGYYKKLMDDLNAGIKATSDNPFQQFIGSYKAAAIAGNIRVVAQQPTSIMRALEEIDPQDFLLGMAEARPGQWENEIKKYAPIAIWKDWGYFTADTGRQMRNIFWGDDNILQTANNFIMNNRFFSPGAADAVTWTAIWNAVKRETKRTRKDLNPDAEEFMYAVRDRFNEVINLTQVVDGIPQRSQLMRSENDVTKMATSFMGEPTTTYNMASYALHKVRTSTGAERGKAMRDLARTTMALVSSIALVAAAQSLVDAMRDDDKDEGYWEKFFQALYGWEGDTRKDRIKSAILNGNLGAGMNPLTYIPFIKDVISKRQGYKVTRMDMDIISRVMDSYDAVVKAMNGEGKKTRKNAWINFIAECSRFLGVPVANIKRDILSGASTVFQATGNYRYQYEMEKFLYNIEGTGNFSEFAKLAYLAKRDGDTEAYEAIRADLIANGPKSEKDVDKKIAEFEKKAVTDTAEYQTEMANLSDSYATMLESNATFQAMDAEQQDKARTTMADYAEYQVLGDRIKVDNSQMENLSSIESQGMNPADWVVFKTQFDTLHSDKDANGKDIPGQKKQDKAIKLIDETFETDEEKCAAYRTVYDSDANNPWA